MTELGSAPVPEPTPDEHHRGPLDAPPVIEYGDFECPYCAALAARLAGRRVHLVFRHFPVRTSHPRAWPSAAAAEAAALQGRFWEMYDLLFADQGRLEDPHLWRRARTLGLDLDRFESDRRGEDVRARVMRDFNSGVRAGVVTTPTLFAGGRMYAGRIDPAVLDEIARVEAR